MKKIIRLTEGDLHKIVKKSVSKILQEAYFNPNDDGFDDDDELLTAYFQIMFMLHYKNLKMTVDEANKYFELCGGPLYERCMADYICMKALKDKDDIEGRVCVPSSQACGSRSGRFLGVLENRPRLSRPRIPRQSQEARIAENRRGA